MEGWIYRSFKGSNSVTNLAVHANLGLLFGGAAGCFEDLQFACF